MNDIRLGLRLCLRHPVLSLAAIFSLALGIGANTAIFTVLNGSVLRPLPYADPDQLMVVWETGADQPRRPVAPANFLDWRRSAQSFAALAAFDDFSVTLTAYGDVASGFLGTEASAKAAGRTMQDAQRLRAVSASANFFDVLGVTAQIGRAMVPADDEPGAERVAVLTDGLWHRLFGGRASALGRTLVLNDIPHTIVGVLPAAFDWPMAAGAEVWMTGDRGIPRSFPFPGDITTVRDAHIISVIGRLAPGATQQQAQSQLSIVMAQLAGRYPDSNAGLGVNVMPLHEQVVGNVRPLVILLQAAVAVLLLIACANVAHLLLGQAAGRHAEMSLRVALGAARSRLVGQLLAETLLIAIPGGIAGVALAMIGVRALVAVAPASIPRLDEIAIDGSVLAFSIVITLATALVFGLGPALQTARTSANDLAQIGQRVAGHRGVRRGHQAVVIGELALAQVLLVGAGLLLASFMHATRVDLGFATADRIAAEINLVPGYVTPAGEDGRIDTSRKIRYITTVLESVRQTPGVRAVAASFTAPLTGAPNRGIRIEGDPPGRPGDQPNADFQVVSADFFTTLGIPLVAGRVFDGTDRIDTPSVAIINQALADRYLAGRDPIGQVLLFGGNRRHRVVGVVADTRYRSVEQPADPTFYLPLEQNDERWPFLAFTAWGGSAATLRDAIRAADPGQPVSRIRSVDEILDVALAPRRFNTWVIGLFAITALTLAAVGIYGVMSFSVSSRTRELGVRAALGATPQGLVRLVMRQGLLLTALASAIGLGAAAVMTRFMASMLYGVSAQDPLTLALVSAVLSVVALTATLIPARRASQLGVGDLFRA